MMASVTNTESVKEKMRRSRIMIDATKTKQNRIPKRRRKGNTTLKR